MAHPFQCITSISSDNGSCLLAACGSKILSVKLDGTVASEWSAEAVLQSNSAENDDEEDKRPAKKQKTAPVQAIVAASPNVIKLVVSPNQEHVVAITDDKAVRVFSIDADFALNELSQRVMPKRPCAIEVLPDNATILCGDKFGDVYSLPLVASPINGGNEAVNSAPQPTAVQPSTFKPSATTLTVHSGRNRLALEQQMKQKNLTAKSKEPLKFEHKLLLGHVSMLTDHTFATREIDCKQRGYIITADRDEHIRISRGPPQAHVIEGYCLGHTEFISKICLIPGTDLLVSGGGDDWLGVWEWPSFKLRRKLDIRAAISGLGSEETRVAISGLWIAPAVNIDDGMPETVLVATSEQTPALFCMATKSLLEEDSTFTTVEIPKSPLDLTCIDDELLLSLDERTTDSPRLQAYRLTVDASDMQTTVLASRSQETETKLAEANKSPSSKVEEKPLNDLLYGIANLRKRGDASAPDEQTAE
ncbi:Hypothetical protein R9X50_00539800 [Acrodontium crateriforme]|uniref:Transfer RNA methyltransferase 82 n=1 Tax=Acrodontium crateriforme TaxID=150365 RepID=A0AAQ3RD74_9PEZI|nr:Hypothetical protein R9X50_00539800 [Acrodontium crateriforme]